MYHCELISLVVIVQLLSHCQLFVTPQATACQSPVSSTVSRNLFKFMCIESVVLSNHLCFCHCFLLLSSVFPSIGAFSSESALHIRWPKCWSFSFSNSSSNDYSELISFRTDWFDLAVQGTLKIFLQHHSSKASILWHSAFFMVQLSYPYMTTGKTLALTVRTFVGKVMCLLFNIVSICLGLSWHPYTYIFVLLLSIFPLYWYVRSLFTLKNINLSLYLSNICSNFFQYSF